jgi:hypothetical protein
MKRPYLLALIFPLMLILTGLALSQETPLESFQRLRQIGQIAPQSIKYDPNFDRLVMVDAEGRLLLVDAKTFETQHILHESGTYSAYEFSHDGRWLALEVDRLVELWNTQTGQRELRYESSSALGYSAPLQFSDDNLLLLFTMVVTAPDDIRRSETDTSLVPYIWDIGAELDLRDPVLPENVLAQPFFDLRNGFVLGPNNTIVAARIDLVEVIDIGENSYPVITPIETYRAERDPMEIWFSRQSDQIYFRPLDGSGLYQINSQTRAAIEIPLGYELYPADVANLDELVLSEQARIIGDANTLKSNSFLRLLLGENYHSYYNNHPLTVTLLDVLTPVTVGQENFGFLVYILDEETGRGVVDFIQPQDTWRIALAPDNTRVAVRRASGEMPAEIYNLATGELETSIIPALPSVFGSHMLAFDKTGEELIVHFQRFNARTGELLNQDLSYHPGFESYFFSEDGQSLITITGNHWWQWDIATGEILRREKVNLRGEVLQRSPDSRRYLTSIETEQGRGVEVVDIGADERRSVFFQPLPGRGIQQVIPSPDWEHYLVVYEANQFSPYYPGNEVALYSLNEGLLHFLAGDDLPAASGRNYGWSDNQTAYIASTFDDGGRMPQRIYGLEYAPSGLPACLVANFPEEWMDWRDIWERLNNRLRSDELGLLTQQLCEAASGTIEDVNLILDPPPTPTLPYYTPTPAFVAGLPACITQAYPDDALRYAEQWRQLTEGLSPQGVEQMQALVCEGLQSGAGVPGQLVPARDSTSVEVMTIDTRTGNRAVGSFFPPTPPAPRDIAPVLNEFRLTEGYVPTDAVLSDDAQYLAVRTPENHVQIYYLARSYESLLTDIRATEQARLDAQPDTIAIAPTATLPYQSLGQPRPTLTPTVTLTPPPQPTELVQQANYGQETTLCSANQPIYLIQAPPPGYAATGRLLTNDFDFPGIWVYDVASGEARYDETLTDAGNGQLSFDQEWLLQTGANIIVSKPDGSDPVTLFTAEEQAVWPQEIYWLDSDTVEYVYQGYLPEQFRDAVTLIRQYDAPTKTLSAPFLPPPSITINQLNTQTISRQPGRGPLAVVTTPFNTGMGVGYKYYLYDTAEGAADYFARLDDGSALELVWNPLGTALYYRYPNQSAWNIFDVRTRQHRLLGEFPGGTWSRDGRYLVSWYLPSNQEIEALLDAEQPIPKLRIWDSQTGLNRYYCVPETGSGYLETAVTWSPDNRYLAFQVTLPADQNYEVYRPRTLILDTETGSVTQLSFDISRIIVWTE